MPRRSLVYVAAWLAATSLGVAISWAGVRGVLSGATVPPPAPVSVPRAASPTASPSGTPTSSSPSASKTIATTQPSKITSTTPAPSDTGKVRSFTVRGGHVALAFYPHKIRLISATPNPGWETDVFDEPNTQWLRVDFHRDRDHSGIIGSWNDGRPTVQTVES